MMPNVTRARGKSTIGHAAADEPTMLVDPDLYRQQQSQTSMLLASPAGVDTPIKLDTMHILKGHIMQ